MKNEHGADAFVEGCPVCQELCCCVNKTVHCNRKNHCYRKCPASKSTDSVAKANMTVWDFRGEAFAGGGGGAGNGKETAGAGNANNANNIPMEAVPTSNIIRPSSNGSGSGSGDGFGVYREIPSEFHYVPLNTLSLSKNGSLDFLAAAVSIMDNNSHENYNSQQQQNGRSCSISNSDSNNNSSNCSNNNNSNSNSNSNSSGDNKQNGNEIHSDSIRKRFRESESTSSSSLIENRENRPLSPSNLNGSLCSMDPFGGKSYETEKMNHKNGNENNGNENKTVRTLPTKVELPQHPLYFLAQKSLLMKNSKSHQITNEGEPFQAEGKAKWESNLKILTTKLEDRNANSSSQLRKAGIVTQENNEQFNFVSSNTSPSNHVDNINIKSDSCLMDENDEECSLKSSYSSISSNILSQNQLVRNVSLEDSITRKLLSGPGTGSGIGSGSGPGSGIGSGSGSCNSQRDIDLQCQSIFTSNKFNLNNPNNLLKNNIIYPITTTTPTTSSFFFNSLDNTIMSQSQTQLHPPPL